MVLEVAEGWWRVAKRRADKVKPPRVSAFLLSWPGCTRGYRNARRSRRMSPLDYDTTQRSTAPACNGCERTLRLSPLLQIGQELDQLDPSAARFKSTIVSFSPFSKYIGSSSFSIVFVSRANGAKESRGSLFTACVSNGLADGPLPLILLPSALLSSQLLSIPTSGSLNPSIQAP